MKAIIVTQTQFNELNTRVQQYCVENIAGYKAVKWAEELIHPTDGRIAFAVEDKILASLTDTEKSKIIDLPEDWFPATEI